MSPNIFIPLESYGLISCQGEKSETFLQGQLTCDMRLLSPKKASHSCYCDHKGRVLSTFRIFLHHDLYYLNLPKNILEPTLPDLKKFGAFSKVNCEDVSQEFQQIGLIGPEIEANLGKIFKDIPVGFNQIIADKNFILLRVTPKQPAFLLIIKKDSAPDVIEQLQQNATVANENAWDLMHIHAKIAKIYPQTIGLFTPHALNYPALDAVSVNKGCYRGQEIVARMHYLGKLKSHLVQAQVTGEYTPEPGSKIINSEQQNIGEIVMVAKEKNHTYALLIHVLDEAKANNIYLAHETKPLVTIVEEKLGI